MNYDVNSYRTSLMCWTKCGISPGLITRVSFPYAQCLCILRALLGFTHVHGAQELNYMATPSHSPALPFAAAPTPADITPASTALPRTVSSHSLHIQPTSQRPYPPPAPPGPPHHAYPLHIPRVGSRSIIRVLSSVFTDGTRQRHHRLTPVAPVPPASASVDAAAHASAHLATSPATLSPAAATSFAADAPASTGHAPAYGAQGVGRAVSVSTVVPSPLAQLGSPAGPPARAPSTILHMELSHATAPAPGAPANLCAPPTLVPLPALQSSSRTAMPTPLARSLLHGPVIACTAATAMSPRESALGLHSAPAASPATPAAPTPAYLPGTPTASPRAAVRELSAPCISAAASGPLGEAVADIVPPAISPIPSLPRTPTPPSNVPSVPPPANGASDPGAGSTTHTPTPPPAGQRRASADEGHVVMLRTTPDAETLAAAGVDRAARDGKDGRDEGDERGARDAADDEETSGKQPLLHHADTGAPK